MNYQPVSDLAQLQLLGGMAHVLLYGILAAIAVVLVILLCLCLAEARLPHRGGAAIEERDRRRRGEPYLAARHDASLDRLTPIRLPEHGGREAWQSVPGPATDQARSHSLAHGPSLIEADFAGLVVQGLQKAGFLGQVDTNM